MTNYVGELQRVKTTATDLDGVTIGPDDVTSVQVRIFKSGVNVVELTDMTWNVDGEFWFYLWVTREGAVQSGAPLATGSYQVEIVIVDLDDHESVEYKRHRLSRRPS